MLSLGEAFLEARQTLVLWDVDGTLLTTDGIASDAMRAAMGTIFRPTEQKERTFYSGKTDSQIIRDTYPDIGYETIFERMDDFRTAYLKEMDNMRSELVKRTSAFPGVVETVSRLNGRVVQAPLTGNVAPVARLKLDILGLLAYIDADIGAYGDDHYERHRLVSIAAERANSRHNHTFSGQDIVVIGDTPKDIECGRMNHTRVVVVATGPYSVDQLQLHNPDAVLEDLSDVDAAIAAILG